jgi:hypothetical protein
LVARYQAEGIEGLKDQSRAPLHHASIQMLMVARRKGKNVLQNSMSFRAAPCVSD